MHSASGQSPTQGAEDQASYESGWRGLDEIGFATSSNLDWFDGCRLARLCTAGLEWFEGPPRGVPRFSGRA